MKAKIFAKLKQEYAPLGLGDEYLMSKADSLAATGLVTDDNIDAVVACQRKELEGLQKANDKRVTDALEKERKKHEEETRKKVDELEAAHKKALEDAKSGNPANDPEPPAGGGADPRYDSIQQRLEQIIAEGKKRDEDNAAVIKTLTESRDNLSKQVKELADKNALVEAERAKAARIAMITAKAKELGVPDWRIGEGFNIADDATEESITETLTKVANNISTNLLPGNRGGFPLAGSEPSEAELKAMAASIVK